MTTYFTSDLHLGHRFVAGLRGFDSADEHDEAIVKRWKHHVTDGDDVWVLGDLAASSPDAALEIIGSLPGRKHLISGNHDKVHPMHRDAHKHQRKYLEVFESVQPFARRKIGEHYVLLSHFPYSTDRDEPRYVQYRLRDEGMYLLHGHTHSSEVVTSAREFHVGVDAWDLYPVSLETIHAIMEGRHQ